MQDRIDDAAPIADLCTALRPHGVNTRNMTELAVTRKQTWGSEQQGVSDSMPHNMSELRSWGGAFG